MTRLRIATPTRRTRRAERDRRGEHIDLRRTLRGSLRTGGDPIRLARRRRRVVRRRLVLLCDISGSMEPYARAYLQFLTCAAGSGPDAEAFVFATRLTRITRALATRSPERAIQRAAAAAPDWSSGTRIGDALRAFNDRHGRRGMARGAVIVILSDGWERGEPALVGARDGAARAARLPDRVGQPARRAPPASRRAPAAWRRRCRTSTRSSAATASTRSARSPTRSPPSAARRAQVPPAPEPEAEEPWASATPVAGSSVAMPSGYGPSRGRTTPGMGADDEDLHLPRLRPPRRAAAPARRPAAGVLRPRGPQRADRAPGARSASSASRPPTTRGDPAMADEAYRAVFLRVHPTGKMVLSLTTEADGNEARYAQLVADELGVPPLDVKVVPGRREPLRQRATASTRARPAARRRAIASATEKIRAKAQLLAGAALETPADGLRWDDGAFVGDGGVADDRRPRALRARHRRAAARRRGRARRADRLPGLMAMIRLGPEHGTLTVHTGARAARPPRPGHDLELEVTRWERDARRRRRDRRSTADPRSLRVRRRQRRHRRRSATRRRRRSRRRSTRRCSRAARSRSARAASTPTRGGLDVEGELELLGVRRAARVRARGSTTGTSPAARPSSRPTGGSSRTRRCSARSRSPTTSRSRSTPPSRRSTDDG